MLIFQTKYIIGEISPFIKFAMGDGEMTEHFGEAYMYDSKNEAEAELNTWDEDAREGVKIFPVEITCRL